MFYLPDPRERPPEPPKAPTGPPTWEDIRTCALVLKTSGAAPAEILQRLEEMGLDQSIAARLVMALFPAPPKKRGRHRKAPPPAGPQDDAKRLERAYLTALARADAEEEEAEEETRARRCDHCGQRIHPGLAQTRIKSETELHGQVAQSRTIQVTLCPVCAASYDGAEKYLVRVLLWLAALGLFAVCSGWIGKAVSR